MKKNKLFCAVLFLILCVNLYAQQKGKPDSILVNLDFDNPGFKLSKNFDFNTPYIQPINRVEKGGKIPRARIEGESLIDIKQITIVPSEIPGCGNAIQYTLGPQKPTDYKARAEHYIFVGDFDKTYISEFSLKLHPNFTPIMEKRTDGGSAWCCLHQWHQSSPESPPISLNIKKGTNNVLFTNFLYGIRRGSKIKFVQSSEKTVQLGKWYHFRYEWHVEPGTDKSYCKIWMSDEHKGDELNNKDLWYSYVGPIGYTLEGKPENEMEPLSRNLREQLGIYQNTHPNPNSFHAVIYDNVKIYQKNK